MAENYRKEYLARIHRAQDYIENHLGEALTLEAIADAAHFSPFHFHRLYTAITGESLYQFIQRVRLERAASRLCQQPQDRITEVALDMGFSSSATFARAFREYFGVSASRYRLQDSKNRKMLGKEGKVLLDDREYSVGVPFNNPIGSNTMTTVAAKKIEVLDMPAKSLAYVRHVGPYAGDAALFMRLWEKLATWAGPRGLLQAPDTEMITVYHDNPEITEASKLRLSMGLTVKAGTETSGEIGLLTIPAGKYVCALFEIDVSEYGAAWQTLCGEWLPQSGWQPDDNPTYECNLNNPADHPQGKHIVEIRMGVKPL